MDCARRGAAEPEAPVHATPLATHPGHRSCPGPSRGGRVRRCGPAPLERGGRRRGVASRHREPRASPAVDAVGDAGGHLARHPTPAPARPRHHVERRQWLRVRHLPPRRRPGGRMRTAPADRAQRLGDRLLGARGAHPPRYRHRLRRCAHRRRVRGCAASNAWRSTATRPTSPAPRCLPSSATG